MGFAAEIVILFVLVLANGALAMSEIAVVSARRALLERRAQAGDHGARTALELQRDPGRFLSTVQIGITLIGIFAGAFGGVTLSRHLEPALAAVPGVAPYSDPLAVALVVVAVTYLSLVLGELVPKRLALAQPEIMARRMAGPLGVLSRLAAPAVWVLEASTDAVLRLFGAHRASEPTVTEDELRHLLEVGRRAGVFEAAEQEIVERVLRLGDRRVGEVVTRRRELVALDLASPAAENRAKVTASDEVLFPVYEQHLDHVVGVVSVHDLLARNLAGEPFDLRAVLREPVFLPETLPVFAALERFRSDHLLGALVIDEHGGIEGLLTLRDLLEAIVGELPTPEEAQGRPSPGIVRRADGSLLVDGRVASGELADLLAVGETAEEELDDYETVAGFVLGRSGRIPAAGDAFHWSGHRFEVIDMDDRRIDKVLVTPAAAATRGAGAEP
ncbi:MAG TPA: hemolysin family protein [Thermoanaerobaculia bacterium]|nr:hemolysin family protein [Thermoanaerobaculia bacterium]